MSAQNLSRTKVTSWRQLLINGGLAIVIAIAANVLVYGVASVVGAMPQEVYVRPGQPITLVAVVGTTFSSIVVAIGIFALLLRFTRRPLRWFMAIAAVVLILSFVTPFGVPGAPVLMIVALELMHVATAVITVVLLTRAI